MIACLPPVRVLTAIEQPVPVVIEQLPIPVVPSEKAIVPERPLVGLTDAVSVTVVPQPAEAALEETEVAELTFVIVSEAGVAEVPGARLASPR